MQEFSDHFINIQDELKTRMKRIQSLVETKFDQPLRTLTLDTGKYIKEAYFYLLDHLQKVQIFMGSVVNFAHVIQPMQMWRKPVSKSHFVVKLESGLRARDVKIHNKIFLL